jgi:hypothetical protein
VTALEGRETLRSGLLRRDVPRAGSVIYPAREDPSPLVGGGGLFVIDASEG